MDTRILPPASSIAIKSCTSPSRTGEVGPPYNSNPFVSREANSNERELMLHCWGGASHSHSPGSKLLVVNSQFGPSKPTKHRQTCPEKNYVHRTKNCKFLFLVQALKLISVFPLFPMLLFLETTMTLSYTLSSQVNVTQFSFAFKDNKAKEWRL